ncbi:hypothetical protein VTO73DRAFT_40 [Trametes versicolor]
MSTSTHPSLSLVSTPTSSSSPGRSASTPLRARWLKAVSRSRQSRRALQNMKAIIEAGGSEVGKVVKTTVFLKNMEDFKAVNAVYSAFFGNHTPARSAVEVARLPLDALFEIEAIVNAA